MCQLGLLCNQAEQEYWSARWRVGNLKQLSRGQRSIDLRNDLFNDLFRVTLGSRGSSYETAELLQEDWLAEGSEVLGAECLAKQCPQVL